MSLFDEPVTSQLLSKYAPAKWKAVKEGVIPLFAADPDFRVALEIREAAANAAIEGVYSYGEPYGDLAFREVIAKTLSRRKSLVCTPSDIMVTSGVAQAMMIVARYACRPGDEAIIFDPVDFLFGRAVDEAGAKRVSCGIDKETREIDVEELKGLITSKSRLLCFCNPHNPLGRVFRKDELRAVADLAVDNRLIVMNDEIWSDIVYTGHKHISLATLGPEIDDRTITLQGFSKTFGLAGLHLGYIVATNPDVMKGLKKVSPSYFYVVNTVSQAAGCAAYTKAWGWVEAFLRHLEEVRDLAYRRLNEMPGVKCEEPEGTYVIFPDVSSFGLTSEEMASYIREEAKVGVVPGHGIDFSYFGQAAEGNIRMAFATTKPIITSALDRIEAALNKLL
jgi:aspartate/methionine/tyrosine aminotransferase